MKEIFHPKKYFFAGRTLKWGKNLTPDQMQSLRSGECFVLRDAKGVPHKEILMDSYDQIREHSIGVIGVIDRIKWEWRIFKRRFDKLEYGPYR